MNANAMTRGQLLASVHGSEAGLTSEEAKKRLAEGGGNRLVFKKKKSFISRIFASLCDKMIIILLLAAEVSFIASLIGSESSADPIIILAIVLLNSVIGSLQEGKAEKALEALKKLSSPEAHVLRDGTETVIPCDDVVVGDVLLLRKGGYVPADAYLLEANELAADESSLTGESLPVSKSTQPTSDGAHITEMHNIVLSGTVITSGTGRAAVFAVGMDSSVGRIAGMIDTSAPDRTPLQKRLAKTGGMLGNAALFICALVFLLSLMRGLPPQEMFLTSVSLAVAAIPEGLPAIVTIILSNGVREMASRKAVVKKLPAVETLGCAAVICSDKTGTLTQNKMTVTEHRGDAGRLALLCALCGNRDSPTENALAIFAEKSGTDICGATRKYPRMREIPFDSSRKYMITVHRAPGGFLTVIKGAPEVVLPKCGGEPEMRTTADEMASRALRVLAFGMYSSATEPADPSACRFTCVGLCGMIDPPRPEVYESVRLCRRAGIKPVMITGDHRDTAVAVAKSIGICREGDRVYTESELAGMDLPTLSKAVKDCSVFARTTPEFKLRIVDAYKYGGSVVAMTGDGVNDAPALRRADIGCAMGISGTDVAKEAADIILTDDNFSTIIEAVKYGRGIYANIRRAVHFLLSCNIGEIITVFAAILFALPSPLAAIQLLWVNLVTDSLPAVALGMEKVSDRVMKRKPVRQNESLFSGGAGVKIMLEGTFIGLLALAAYLIGNTRGNPALGRTMCFAVLSYSQLFHSFNMRSEQPFSKGGLLPNPALVISFFVCAALQTAVLLFPVTASLFGVSPLGTAEWLCIAGLSFAPIPVCELSKILRRKK